VFIEAGEVYSFYATRAAQPSFQQLRCAKSSNALTEMNTFMDG
jgi:hypothetical protein